jgi:hypothetical protein
MKTQPTKEQSELALKILIHVSHEGFEARLITKEQRERLKFTTGSKEWWLMPAFIVDGRYWCGWDVHFGHDIVIDIVSKVAKTSTSGIFEDEYVFISNYYVYTTVGVFYYRSK